jgi:hypothetical protein
MNFNPYKSFDSYKALVICQLLLNKVKFYSFQNSNAPQLFNHFGVN